MSRPRYNPVALVTGGARGIGRGISEALAEEGYDLLLAFGTNQEAAEAYAEELRARGTKVAISGGDVAEEETIARYFEVLAKDFREQQLRAVVHNAGQVIGVTAENSAGIQGTDEKPTLGSLLKADGSVDLSHMEYYHNIYAKAWVRIVERSLAVMESGSIVGISSPGCNCTLQPAGGYDMPGSAKTVMETTARYYAKHLAARGVTVNVVIPGATSSDAWKALGKGKGKQGNEMVDMVAGSICPMGRAASCREIGDVVAFLCSPRARYITGVALPVDGGFHLGVPKPPQTLPEGGKGK